MPTIEEIKAVMATLGCDWEGAIEYITNQRSFQAIQNNITALQNQTYQTLSPSGQTFVADLKNKVRQAQENAWNH